MMEANGTSYATEKANLATRLGVTAAQVLSDVNTATGATKTALLREEIVLSGRFSYAVTKLDRDGAVACVVRPHAIPQRSRRR